jgi:hypothetical protein
MGRPAKTEKNHYMTIHRNDITIAIDPPNFGTCNVKVTKLTIYDGIEVTLVNSSYDKKHIHEIFGVDVYEYKEYSKYGTPFTTYEIGFIKKYRDKIKIKDIGNILGRKGTSISQYIHRHKELFN